MEMCERIPTIGLFYSRKYRWEKEWINTF
jgi:hypothetical protein